MQITLDLWVENQDEIDADVDCTEAYIRATGWQPPRGIVLAGQQLSGEAETVYSAFRDLAAAVADEGHGEDVDPEAVALPSLTACPVDSIAAGYTTAAESLARMTCREYATYAEWSRAF